MKDMQKQKTNKKIKGKHLLWGLAPLAIATPIVTTAVIAAKANNNSQKIENTLSQEEVAKTINEEIQTIKGKYGTIYGEDGKTPLTDAEIKKVIKGQLITNQDKTAPVTKSWVRKFVTKELAELEKRLKDSFTKFLQEHDQRKIDKLIDAYEAKWEKVRRIKKVELATELASNKGNHWLQTGFPEIKDVQRSREELTEENQILQLTRALDAWIDVAEKYNAQVEKANKNIRAVDEYEIEYAKYDALYSRARNFKQISLTDGAVIADEQMKWIPFTLQKEFALNGVKAIRDSMKVIQNWLDHAIKYNNYVNKLNENLLSESKKR